MKNGPESEPVFYRAVRRTSFGANPDITIVRLTFVSAVGIPTELADNLTDREVAILLGGSFDTRPRHLSFGEQKVVLPA